MAREKRHNQVDSWYHIYNRGKNGRKIFLNEKDKYVFLNQIAKAVNKFEFRVSAFCLMDNHYHLLAYNISPDLSKSLQLIGQNYVVYFNNNNEEDGPLFSKRFQSKHIDTDTYFHNCFHYIHNNAKDLESVSDISNYKFSSLRNYLHNIKKPNWLWQDPCLDKISDLDPRNQQIMDLDLAYYFELIQYIEKEVSKLQKYCGLTVSDSQKARSYEVNYRDLTVFIAYEHNRVPHKVLTRYYNFIDLNKSNRIVSSVKEKIKENNLV